MYQASGACYQQAALAYKADAVLQKILLVLTPKFRRLVNKSDYFRTFIRIA